MAEHAHTSIADEKNFEFTAAAKRRLMVAFVIGLVLFIIGVVLLASGIDGGSSGHEVEKHAAITGGGGGHDAHADDYHWTKRVFANLWLDAVLFNGIALIGVFFVAVNYVAYAGWSVVFRRIPEAFGYFLMVTAVIIPVLFLVSGHDLFHWTHADLYDPSSPNYDKILVGKRGYLNTPFYMIRMLVYFAAWIGLFFIIRRNSLKEDSLPKQNYKTDSIKLYNKNVYMSAVFLFVFAVTSSTSAWDWVMSIDAHWFSTMFGWYCFASWFVSGLATITLTVILLKEQGYLKAVNENHLHDLGKFMFAFSVFWTYIWFSQFHLYHYANIPEEIIYFTERFSGHNGIYFGVFFLNLFVNFAFPFLMLMTRNAKRKMLILKIVAIGILVGHYLDFYLMVMPGTVGKHAGFGPVEFGALIMFISAFIYVISNALSKANIVPKNDPFIKESVNHVVV
ncbi:MAG: quinol:cytochrome C oxidoreductase [Cytophagales bacterium]|nr:MAG: quinol:cytochrome C oxidoreductase [Cytophagales bacterium]